MIIQPSDAVLVTRALNGDAAAFESLVLRHQRKAHAVARAHGVPAAAGDDVVQDALLAAYRGLDSLREREKFAPWLLSIARAAARKYSAGRESPPAQSTSLVLDADPAAASPADQLEAAELREHVRRRVLELPEGLREAIFLYYYEGRSTREAARALDTSTAAVKKRLQKGRDILREELWRELASSLRDLLPSTRGWRTKGRSLALVILAATPAAVGRTADGTETLAGGGAGTAAVSTWLACGGILMSAKKLTCATAAALLLLGLGGWLAFEAARPERREAADVATPVSAQTAARERVPPAIEATPESVRTDQPRPVFRVRVVDEAGEIVADATVRAAWANRDDRVVLRILAGVGSLLENVGPGELVARSVEGDVVCLTAAAPSCRVPRCEKLDIPPVGLADPIVLRLERCEERVRFRLFDPRRGDAPVAGARVGPIVGNAWHAEGEPQRGLPPPYFAAPREVPRLYEVVSDEDGELSFCLRPDADSLWATCEGYGPTAMRDYSARRPEAGAVLSIPMYPPITLRIAVRSADGAPIQGFQLGLGHEGDFGPPDPDLRVVGAETVREIHHLVLVDPQPRSVRKLLVVVKTGDVKASAQVEIAYGEENNVEVVLQPGTTVIHGRVIDAMGAPVAGAEVGATGPTGAVRLLDDRPEPPLEPTVTTAEDGTYEIVFPSRPEPFCLLAYGAGQPLHATEMLRLEAGERRRHDIVLPAAGSITAQLAETIAQRVGVEIRLTNEEALTRIQVDYRKQRITNEEGLVCFEGVPAGTWTLTWRAGRCYQSLPVAVEAGKNRVLVLGEPDAGVVREVRGILTAGGAPVAQQDLRIYGDGRCMLDIATSDENGSFAFRDVPPGTRSLCLESSAERPGAPHHYFRVEIEEGMAPLRLDITPATVTGRVVGDAGPVVGVTVKPYTVQHVPGGASLASFHSVQTDASGGFRLPWLLGSPILLVFERAGYLTRRIEWRQRGSLDADLEDDAEDDLEYEIGEVRLEPDAGVGVRFRVVGEAGEEIPSVCIDLHAVDLAAPLHVARIHRAALGYELAVKALPAGRYRAIVQPGDLAAQEHTTEVVEFEHRAGINQDLRVVTHPGGSVNLELRSSDGSLPPVAAVEIFSAGGQPTLGWRGEQRLSFSGSAALMGLPRGPLTARVSSRGWKTVEVPFEVVPGRVATITAAMERE